MAFETTKSEAMTAVGSATALLSASKHYLGLTLDQWSLIGIWIGIATALAGLGMNWYFQRQRIKLMSGKPQEFYE